MKHIPVLTSGVPWIEEWLDAVIEREGLRQYVPIVGSVDIRQDVNGRVCAVDPNRFPQGFNNVWEGDYGTGAALITRRIYAPGLSRLHVVVCPVCVFLLFIVYCS
jgi:hypothetical protein